jgi:Zinc finger, C3HC4 type (RING finger)
MENPDIDIPFGAIPTCNDVSVDVYPIEYLLNKKHKRTIFGTYTMTSKVLFKMESVVGCRYETSGVRITDQSYERDVVFNCTGADPIKLCISFIFWSHDITQALSNKTLDNVKDLIVFMINLHDHPTRSYIRGCLGDVNKLSAMIIYILAHLNRKSIVICRMVHMLLDDFLGARGFGNRRYVFGEEPGMRYDSNSTKSLPYKFNNILSDNEFESLTRVVEERNNELRRLLSVKKHSDDIFTFMTELCQCSVEEYGSFKDIFTYRSIPFTIKNVISLAETTYNSTKINLSSFRRTCAIIHRTVSSEICVYCWLRRKDIMTCHIHGGIIEPAGVNTIIQEKSISVQEPNKTIHAEKPPTPSAPPEPSAPTPSAPTPSTPTVPECTICFDATINTRLDPCGHMYCNNCAYGINTCPHCRTVIIRRDITYIV